MNNPRDSIRNELQTVNDSNKKDSLKNISENLKVLVIEHDSKKYFKKKNQ